MEPERVSRVILDGVVDTDDYYNGNWLANLQDTDHVIDRFAEYCYEAGDKDCSLYSHAGAPDVRKRFDCIVASLKKKPLGVPASRTRGPAIITYSDLKKLIKTVIYKPYAQFRMLSDVMHGIETGNGSLLADQKLDTDDLPRLTPECHLKGPYSDACNPPSLKDGFVAEVASSILCTDAQSQTSLTRDEFVDYWHTLRSQSETIGDLWAEIRMACISWNVTARNKFDGHIGGATAAPLLFVGNAYDPVTPLRNAFKMSARFHGSAVLQQDSEGHCSLAGPSVCSAKVIRDYFHTGRLPEKGTVCPQDESPFARVEAGNAVVDSALEAADAALLEALRKMSMEGLF